VKAERGTCPFSLQEVEMNLSYSECPKCKGDMEDGFIADRTDGNPYVSRWVEGQPEKTWNLGVRIKGKVQRNISTYRCCYCGYLESYAK
jgi:hypothetical protein